MPRGFAVGSQAGCSCRPLFRTGNRQAAIDGESTALCKRTEKATRKSFLRKALCLVPPDGLEQPQENAGNSPVRSEGGANSGAVGARTPATAGELAEVVEAWPHLPAELRRSILGTIRATLG